MAQMKHAMEDRHWTRHVTYLDVRVKDEVLQFDLKLDLIDLIWAKDGVR